MNYDLVLCDIKSLNGSDVEVGGCTENKTRKYLFDNDIGHGEFRYLP